VKSSGGRLSKCSAESFPARTSAEVPPELSPAIHPLLSEIASLTAKIREYDRRIESLCEQDYPETRTVRQIPGVGPVTALAFVLTLEDPVRFRQNRAIGPFLGLTPKRDQSGDTDKAKSISKAGDAYLRRLLTQSAHYILGPFGPDCQLRRCGLRIAASGGKAARRRAVTAVARKLAVLALHLWKTAEPYDPLHRRSAPRTGQAQQAA